MKYIHISKKKLLILSIAYIYIPIVIFLVGWVRFPIALICIGCLLYGIYKLFCDYSKTKEKVYSDSVISIWGLGFACGLFLVVGYYAGWGRFVTQAGDWAKHNAVLADLVNKPWPVYYINQITGIEEHSMLTYYIAQYMLPALFGKIFHSFRVAEIVNFLWAEIGLLLVYLNIVRVLKINTIWLQNIAAFLLCFFCGPLLLGQKLRHLFFPLDNSDGFIYHWFIFSEQIRLQYRSNYVMLRWVFAQVLIIWLITILLFEHKEKIENYVVLILPAMLAGALPFIDLVFIALAIAIIELFRKKAFKIWIRQILSLSNITVAATTGIVFLLYYYGNVLGEKQSNIDLSAIHYQGREILYFFLFISTMAGIYMACLFKENVKNPIYWVILITLVCIPLFKMGVYNDFVMCCSIPSLFILLLLVIKFLNKIKYKEFLQISFLSKISYIVLIVTLMIGFIYPWREFIDSVKSDDLFSLGDEFESITLEEQANRFLEISPDLKYNYFSYDIENNLFYKYMARKQL